MRIHKPTGLPILKVQNLPAELSRLGIVKRRIVSSLPLEDLDKNQLSQAQQNELRFAPKNEVVLLENDEHVWFRTRTKNWACTFVLLPGELVPLTAEYKHGADLIVVTPPAGVPQESESMAGCAKREFEEETGIVLDRVVSLSGAAGLPVSGRKSTERVFPFVGFPKFNSGNLVLINQQLDATEDLKLFLMALPEYWKYIGDGYDNEAGSRDCTYAALRYLGKIKLG